MRARDTKYASRQRPEGDEHDRHEKRRSIKSIRLSVVEEWRWSALSLAFGAAILWHVNCTWAELKSAVDYCILEIHLGNRL